MYVVLLFGIVNESVCNMLFVIIMGEFLGNLFLF